MIETIRRKLDEQCFETARRLAVAATTGPAGAGGDQDLKLLLHEALVHLGEIPEAQRVLKDFDFRDSSERLRVTLLLAEDFHRLSSYDFYRSSEEKAQGFTGDEYAARYEALADLEFDKAIELSDTPERLRLTAESLLRAERKSRSESLARSIPAPAPAPAPVSASTARSAEAETAERRPADVGRLAGTVTWDDGTPLGGIRITIGFPFAVRHANPVGHFGRGIDGGIHAHFEGDQRTLTTETDATGAYRFDDLPAGCYPFLSATLNPDENDIALRFFARDIEVRPGAETRRDGRIEDWSSAPTTEVEHPFQALRTQSGVQERLISTLTLRNPFYFDFPRQFVALTAPEFADDVLPRLYASHAAATPIPVQKLSDGTFGAFLDLPGRASRALAWYAPAREGGASSANATERLASMFREEAGFALIDTGRAQFRIPAGAGTEALAPILAARGENGIWRGAGRLLLPDGVSTTRRTTTTIEDGALRLRVEVRYAFAGGSSLCFELTAHRGEAYLLVRERSTPIEGLAFEFSLREFHGGRGFLHWTPELGNKHWSDLRACNAELARLQESVAWWLPPQGFGYAMTPGGVAEHDYIGVFTVRRGEWIDTAFERIAQGPGDENRELDWPYPEMVGSTISMITAHTAANGDAFFRFAGFEGERQWGLLVSTLERNDGPSKELSQTQHKVSSPRLQDYLRWRLHEPDAVERPCVLITRGELRNLRRKKREPAFAPVWEKMVQEHSRGPSRGLRAIMDSDPALVWRLACEMKVEAMLRARMTLLGRDYADVYSPVGGRGITPFAEQYDLIAATGVFDADEERDVRASLLLMGHMFMEEDLMNWRFNSRNANFEADRTDIVGVVGLAFRGNPDADAMVRHAAELMERSLNVYCTPGSGKWYENPACYYVHAASCRLNLAFHLYRHGILDSTAIPRLRDFLSWGPNLLTARYPHSYTLLRDGCGFDEYERAEKVRRIPPIGDHAKLGQWVSESFALMGKAYRKRDPRFAEFLRWAYQEGGCHGGHFSKFALFFTAMEEEDLRPAPPQTLISRRLEGFGAVLRGKFNRPDEFYLLFKQGPGGYRYHRTEGSFLLMARGRPLVWDGGEAGETWRHSTLSFHEAHMPLAPGHVERFLSLDSVDFVQGVHPKALAPNEPVFLSDSCEHTLVEVAWARHREPNPADVRSVLWVKDEYVVVSDDLRLPPGTRTHWHIQAVSDAHEGHARDELGVRFKGRYGVDLQAIMPGLPEDAEQTVSQLPTFEYQTDPSECFSMRHLQLSMSSPARLDAVLRPLAPGEAPLRAEAFDGGLHVWGDGIDDLLFLSREPLNVNRGDVRFVGRYGAVLRRPGRTTLILLDGALIACRDDEITDCGCQSTREVHS